jgi:hypothetical protein
MLHWCGLLRSWISHCRSCLQLGFQAWCVCLAGLDIWTAVTLSNVLPRHGTRCSCYSQPCPQLEVLTGQSARLHQLCKTTQAVCKEQGACDSPALLTMAEAQDTAGRLCAAITNTKLTGTLLAQQDCWTRITLCSTHTSNASGITK